MSEAFGGEKVTVVPLTLDRVSLLPGRAKQCLYWEFDSETGKQIGGGSDAWFEKEAWLSSVLLQWGTCGQLAVVGEGSTERGVGQICYAPPGMVARAGEFPTAPVSPDAVLVTYAEVEDGFDFDEVGQLLLLAGISDLLRRGVRAVEAFGREERDDAVGAEGVSGAALTCVNPTGFFVAGGFTVVAPHQQYPRLRMELGGGGLLWRQSVEAALAELVEDARGRALVGTAV